MKIFYVIDDYIGAGGIERVIALKANYLVDQGFDIGIIACRSDKTQEPFFHFDPRIRFYDLDLPSNSDKKKNRKLFLSRLNDLLRETRPDITIAAGRKLMYHVCEASDDSKKVLETHFSKYGRKLTFARMEKNLIARFFLRVYLKRLHRQIRKFDRFVVLTEEDKASWQRVGVDASTIPNPLTFLPQEHSRLDQKRIIAVGRHEYQKGFDQLVKIWKQLARDYPDWSLTIIGEGRKKEKLRELIEREGLTGRVELLSNTKNISAEYLDSSIYAMTSNYEGFGMVLLEAMICGVPTVAYSCKCGPRDLVEDGNSGFLVRLKDRRQFVERLRQLMDDECLRHQQGQAARERAMKYRIDAVMPRWRQLFEGLA